MLRESSWSHTSLRQARLRLKTVAHRIAAFRLMFPVRSAPCRRVPVGMRCGLQMALSRQCLVESSCVFQKVRHLWQADGRIVGLVCVREVQRQVSDDDPKRSERTARLFLPTSSSTLNGVLFVGTNGSTLGE